METEIKTTGTIKGTRILTGEVARKRRDLINSMIDICYKYGYEEIVIPIIEYSDVYVDKAGEEVLGQMYTFKDKSDRDLCLRPEGTATCQLMAREKFTKKGM